MLFNLLCERSLHLFTFFEEFHRLSLFNMFRKISFSFLSPKKYSTKWISLDYFSISHNFSGNRVYQAPRIGVSDDKVAQYASLHYYTDKELQVTSESACRLACEIENEFLCRSFLYKGPAQGAQYNCQLFHLDHWTIPDGPSAYLNAERPLIDNGERIGSYSENTCESKYFFLHYELKKTDY